MHPEAGELGPRLRDRFGMSVQVEGLRDLDQRAEVVERVEAFERDPEALTRRYDGAQLELTECLTLALERLDSVGVLVLVHPTYQDQSGTPQADDDVDYTGLKRLLATRFKRTSKVRYRIEYQEVRVRHNEAEVDAYVDATFVYQEPQAAPRWRRLTDYNRFRLLKDGSNWRFVGGL